MSQGSPSTMIGALALWCRAARNSNDASYTQIASDAGVSEGVIKAFEEGRTWPKKVEAIVDAYARVMATESWRVWDGAASIMSDY